MPDAELGAWLEETRAWADEQLRAVLERTDLGPTRHAKALAYPALGGGKRLRPALVRLVCRSLGGDDEAAAPPAVAVELIHTYSLVHDDLPCMDDDELRRGRPTCHVVYGEAEAVLVGDGLQALAFEVLGASGHPRAAEMVASLARGAGPAGMVGGQSLDLDGAADLDLEGVRAIHRAKTAALLEAAADLGALAADAEDAMRSAMRGYGRALGLCFQAVDDVLDVVGDAATLGKTPGKDAAAGKASLVEALGVDGAREEAARHGATARRCLHEAGLEGLLGTLVDHFLARTS